MKSFAGLVKAERLKQQGSDMKVRNNLQLFQFLKKVSLHQLKKFLLSKHNETKIKSEWSNYNNLYAQC